MASSSFPLGGCGGGGCRRFAPALAMCMVVAVCFSLMTGLLAVADQSKSVTCAKPTGANNSCEGDVKERGHQYIVDCEDAKDTFVPAGMSSTTNPVLCATKKKWTKADETCEKKDEKSRSSLTTSGLIVAFDGSKLRVINVQYNGDELMLSGSCSNTDKSKSSFFNIVVKSAASSAMNGVVMSVVMAMAAAGLLSTH